MTADKEQWKRLWSAIQWLDREIFATVNSTSVGLEIRAAGRVADEHVSQLRRWIQARNDRVPTLLSSDAEAITRSATKLARKLHRMRRGMIGQGVASRP